MKKIVTVCLCIMACFAILGSIKVIAGNQELSRNDIRTINAYLRSKIVFWQKLYDCTPYNTEITGTYFQIIGKENHKCHVKIQNQECYYPMEVAKKYSYNAENLLRKAIDDMNSHGDVDKASIEQESKFIRQINYQYCNTDNF